MDDRQKSYRKSQFKKLQLERKTEYLPKIRISSTYGNTNHLDITPKELNNIINILTNDKEKKDTKEIIEDMREQLIKIVNDDDKEHYSQEIHFIITAIDNCFKDRSLPIKGD